MVAHSSGKELKETCFIREDAHVSREGVMLGAHALSAYLADEWGIQARDRVAVVIADTQYLLITVLALQAVGATCMPVDPDVEPGALNGLLKDFVPTRVIAESRYIPNLASHYLALPIDTRPEIWEATAAQSPNLADQSAICLYAGDGVDTMLTVTGAMLNHTFQEMDRLLQPQEDDIFLLLSKQPFKNKLIDLLWAYTRQIPVVINESGRNTGLDQLVPCPSQEAMEFSLFYFGSYQIEDNANKYQLLIDTARYADAHGFSAIWTPERHFNEFGGLFPNPSLLSAALAMITSRLHIRSGSLVSPLHHSVRIAEDWAVVDNLSGGRAAISFASGWQCDDFVFSPEKYEGRHEYMLAQIETVRKLWKGEQVTLNNGLNKEISVEIFPKPLQSELPVWVTVSGKTQTFIDAGKIGAHILTHLLWQDPSELIEKIQSYRKSLAENGYEPASRRVAIMAHTFVGTDYEKVKALVREPLKNYIRSSVHLIQAMAKSNRDPATNQEVIGRYGNLTEEIPPHLLEELLEIAFQRFFKQAGLLGTESDCHAMVRKLKEYGADEVACLIDFGLNPACIMESLAHLNRVRAVHDPYAVKRYPITLSHCTVEDYPLLQADPGSQRLMKGLKKLMVSGDNVLPLPDESGSKICPVQFLAADTSFSLLTSLINEGSLTGQIIEPDDFNAVIEHSF